MASRRGRRLVDTRILVVDTGWVIAAESQPRAAMAFRKKATEKDLVVAIPAIVALEVVAGTTNRARTNRALNTLTTVPLSHELAVRAGELKAAVRGATGEDLGFNDPQVAATAEAHSGVVLTGDRHDFEKLRDAGAGIEPQPLPF